MKKNIFKLDELLVEVGLCNEKAMAVIDELIQNYFSLSNEKCIAFYHENAKIKCNIVQDYIFHMRELLDGIDNITREL